MFIKKVNLVLAALCTIFFQGILSLELYSEERINKWKVDIVIEKKPSEELIKSRKAELDEKIRKEREAADKGGNKENGKILYKRDKPEKALWELDYLSLNFEGYTILKDSVSPPIIIKHIDKRSNIEGIIVDYRNTPKDIVISRKN